MARIETLSAYKCKFSYLQRNNPLKEELHDKIKAGIPPEYTFSDFIDDFCKYTSLLAVGKSTERAISLPKENIHQRPNENEVTRWMIVPYAGKQGKPFKIIKTSNGKRYDYGADSAALYEHKIFVYESASETVIIFHRQNGSGCKSVFLEIANMMLREKGIKLDMELYVPLVPQEDSNITPTKIQLQYVKQEKSSDAAENIHRRKRPQVIQELTLNLKSAENNAVKRILDDVRLGKIDPDVAFMKITSSYTGSEIYNDAEISVRIGKRHQKIRWNEFDSIGGNYDITERLHKKFKSSGDFIGSLTALSDEYYESIIAEEDASAE